MNRKLIGFTALILSFHSSSLWAYNESTVNGGGTIKGEILFSGIDTPAKKYKVTKDNEICGSADKLIDYIRVSGSKLNDVVVYLEKVETGKPFAKEPSEIDQVNCEFTPYLQIVRNKTNFLTKNSDPILHNVHTYELMGKRKRTVFNVNQPTIGQNTSMVKLRRGDVMKVECDAHDFMHSYVFVAKNPYYALVKERGQFTLDNIPAGKYTLKAWHATLPPQKTSIEVMANGTVNYNFNFK